MTGVLANAYGDSQWSKSAIDQKIGAVFWRNWTSVEGAYGPEETEVLFDVIDRYKEAVKGKSVLVVGSETPWVESIILAIGAKHVTTLEYNKIKTNHPKVNKDA